MTMTSVVSAVRAIGRYLQERLQIPVTRVPVVHQYDRHPELNEFVYTHFKLQEEGVEKRNWLANMAGLTLVPGGVRGL